MNRSSPSVLTADEAIAFRRIYDFVSARRYKYGLREEYVRVQAGVTESLRSKGLIWPKYKYGHTYWLLTKAGREKVEGR